MYTIDEIDKKIIEFRERTKDKGLLLHNNYFIFTVDRDGNVCEEAYGSNLMTNYGFRNFYFNDYYYHTGYNDFCHTVKLGTGYDPANGKVPQLNRNTLYEYACKDISRTSTTGVLRTGYYRDPDTMGENEGLIYETTRFMYGEIDYVINLASQTSVNPDHIGGLSTASPRDTRWQTDEHGDDYFKINEIGLSDNNDNDNTSLVFHFAILDKDGNPTPIRKYDNQKMYIYMYHTTVLPESALLDGLSRHEYIAMRPLAGWRARYYSDSNGRKKTIYPMSVEREWKPYSTITRSFDPTAWGWQEDPPYRRSVDRGWGEVSYRFIYSNQPSVAISEDGTIITETFKVPSRLVEKNNIYLTGFQLSLAWDIKVSSNFNIGSADFNMMTYDRQPEPETIIFDDLYTDTIDTDYFSGQFGQNAQNNSYKYALLPMDGYVDIQSIKMFNVQDDDFTITDEYDYPKNFFYQTILNVRAPLYSFECPDHVKRTVYYYPNIFATGAFAGNMTIKGFVNTGITVYACDKAWDINTWELIQDLSNIGNLSKKKYFVTYSNVNLEVVYDTSSLPKIVPKTQYKELDDGTTFSFEMLSNPYKQLVDETNHVLFINNYLIQLDNNMNVTNYNEIYNYNNNNTGYYHSSGLCEGRSGFAAGEYGEWFWWKSDKNHVVLFNTSKYKASTHTDTLYCDGLLTSTISTSSPIHVETNESNLLLIENDAAPYGFYIYNLNKTYIESGITETTLDLDEDKVLPSATAGRTHKYWYTETFITRPASGRLIKPHISWNNGYHSISFRIREYDSNDVELSVSNYSIHPYEFTNPDTAKYKIEFTYNGDTDYYDDYNSYSGVKKCVIQEFDKHDVDIADARHAFFIRGTTKICFTYGSTDYLTKWYVVDATNLKDSGGNPIILNTFTIDSLYAQSCGGCVGFSHHVYMRLRNSDNIWGCYHFDINDNSSHYFTNWDYDWNFRTESSNSDSQYYGDMKCLVFGSSNYERAGLSKTSAYGIYVITEDDPTNLMPLCYPTYTGADDDNYITFNFLFNGFIIRHINDGKQLIFSGCALGNSNNRSVISPFIIDLGRFINNKGHIVKSPYSRTSPWEMYGIDSMPLNYASASTFAIPYNKGIITIPMLALQASNGTKPLVYYPIERFVPHKIELTTKCITAYNNPFKFSDKEFKIQLTNDMTNFGLLNNGGKHPNQEDSME